MDKINCINGLCSHSEHSGNIAWWVVTSVALVYVIYKYRHATNTR